jgi:hypothetical protein
MFLGIEEFTHVSLPQFFGHQSGHHASLVVNTVLQFSHPQCRFVICFSEISDFNHMWKYIDIRAAIEVFWLLTWTLSWTFQARTHHFLSATFSSIFRVTNHTTWEHSNDLLKVKLSHQL